jgi:hypothetical protein
MGLWEFSLLALWIVVAGLAVLVVALLRHMGMLEARIADLAQQRVSRIDRSGLPVGSRAPDLTLLDAEGAETPFAPPPGRRVVVALVQPGCGPCDHLLPALCRLAAGPEAVEVVVITKGVPGGLAVPLGVRVLYQRGAEAMARFRAFATPWVFVVGPTGLVEAQGIASDQAGLRELIRTANITAASMEREVGS